MFYSSKRRSLTRGLFLLIVNLLFRNFVMVMNWLLFNLFSVHVIKMLYNPLQDIKLVEYFSLTNLTINTFHPFVVSINNILLKTIKLISNRLKTCYRFFFSTTKEHMLNTADSINNEKCDMFQSKHKTESHLFISVFFLSIGTSTKWCLCVLIWLVHADCGTNTMKSNHEKSTHTPIKSTEN